MNPLAAAIVQEADSFFAPGRTGRAAADYFRENLVRPGINGPVSGEIPARRAKQGRLGSRPVSAPPGRARGSQEDGLERFVAYLV
jgi:hypothetical protein